MSTRLTLDRTLRVAACLGAILAAGCGGGGDGPAAPQLLQINTQNQVAVARTMIASAISLEGLDEVPIVSAGAAQSSTFAGFTKQALGKAAAQFRAADAMPRPLAVSTRTEPCPFSGSITFTTDDRDNNGIASAGDALTLAFNQCRDSPTDLASGTMVIAIAGLSSTPTSAQFSGRLTADGLSMLEDGYTSSTNGAADFAYAESTDTAGTTVVRLEVTSAAGGLVAKGSTASFNDTFTYDPGFSIAWTDSIPSTATAVPFFTVSLNGTLHAASLGNRIVISTGSATPIHQWGNQSYPDSGQITIHGERSHLRLTVLNTATVRAELDGNDDGTFEATRDILWAELEP